MKFVLNGRCTAVLNVKHLQHPAIVCWPVFPTPLPNSPGVSVSIDYFGPLPTTARGNIYSLLFRGRFSRCEDMFAVTAAEFTAKGTAKILVNRRPFCPITDLNFGS